MLNTESAKAYVVPHLPKASFSQHHQEIEIRKFHPISAPVVVEFRNGICCLLIRSLGPCSNLGSLQKWRWDREKREKKILKTVWRKVILKPASAPEIPH